MKRTLLSLALITLFTVAFVYGVATLRNKLRNPAWKITQVPPDDVICFTLYTLDEQTLKLSAQLYALPPDSDRTVRLEIKEEGRWTPVAETDVSGPDWVALFRVEGWDSSRAYAYRVVHGEGAYYTGEIRADPVDKEEIVVAAFTGNSNQDRGPRPDLIENIERIDPDLLFFSGDQVYDHKGHFASWLLFGRQFGQITRNRPTIVIPDDHDVGNSNLWGEGGDPGPDGYQDPDYVNQVEKAQTSHLPDPYDPTPIKRGIGTYYTSLTWGRIGFAIIEDRKFKSQIDILDRNELERQGVLFSRYDHINIVPDPQLLDVEGATLLGERQLAFLQEWTADWSGQDIKSVLSQAPWAGTAHLHGPSRRRLEADLDSNGWPKSGRDRALRLVRKGFAVLINGDQHLATLLQHGIDQWGDAGFSFSVPSIVNRYRRWWNPAEPEKELPEGELGHTGNYTDGFGNKISMHAYANPDPSQRNYDKWLAQGAGFGIIRFNKRSREITMECWPRGCNVTDPDCEQYPGWPITIHQGENYHLLAETLLPQLEILGQEDPVLQVLDDASGEIVYTLRIKGTSYQPKVPHPGSYTLKIGEGEQQTVFDAIQTLPPGESQTLTIDLAAQED